VSRLSPLSEDDVRSDKATDGPILRRNRRKALHPDAVHDLLRERAARDVCERGPTHFGWAIILWTDAGRRVVVETSEIATYAEACAIRDREMARGDISSAWIKQKAHPSDA
jgi:hypothetical protein